MNGDLTVVCQFCYLRGSCLILKGTWFLQWRCLKCVRWLRLPEEQAVKYLVKLFIDLGREVFPVLCFFLCRRAFKRKTSVHRQSLLIHITEPSTYTVNSRCMQGATTHAQFHKQEGHAPQRFPHSLLLFRA